MEQLAVKQELLAKLTSAPLNGLSEALIRDHWKLYEGYVNQFNTLTRTLKEAREKGDYSLQMLDMRKRLPFEYAGVVLHELYFANLTPNAQPAPERVQQFFAQHFGSFAKFLEEVTKVSATRGVGWTCVGFDKTTGRVDVLWFELHQNNNVASVQPLLMLDCWEHAFIKDFGNTGRPAYLAALMNNVDWQEVDRRIQQATAGQIVTRY